MKGYGHVVGARAGSGRKAWQCNELDHALFNGQHKQLIKAAQDNLQQHAPLPELARS